MIAPCNVEVPSAAWSRCGYPARHLHHVLIPVVHEAGEILGDYPEHVRRTGRELHQVLQRCSHGREFSLVIHRCDRHLQHPAYVLAAEGLLGELHQQEFGPLVGGGSCSQSSSGCRP